MTEQRFLDDVQPGAELVAREYGPLSIIDTVRWAGLQENTQQLHYDRDWVREHAGLRTFIASGAYRQALLMRMLTDWLGPRGRLRKLGIRHTYSTFEGDTMRFAARAVEKSADPADPWIACELEGANQEGRQVLTGRCTLVLPTR
ncbi:MAG: MaoC/PaaZ C-terminal domain-containing protein [Deltaproteobacteria bacterium]|nr:MaoC/PaaZ C-terminal domain-containing protein [Deltaproteobacteria bacterium]